MLTRYKCQKCSHEWIPRKDGRPAQCPHCHCIKWGASRSSTVSAVTAVVSDDHKKSTKKTKKLVLEKKPASLVSDDHTQETSLQETSQDLEAATIMPTPPRPHGEIKAELAPAPVDELLPWDYSDVD